MEKLNRILFQEVPSSKKQIKFEEKSSRAERKKTEVAAHKVFAESPESRYAHTHIYIMYATTEDGTSWSAAHVP